MVDGVLLVVDAYEGPQAQTRFVLRKALENGLSPVIVINKVDRDHSDPEGVQEKVLELLLELGATEEQFELLVSNIDWDNYVGRIALGKIQSGSIRKGDPVWLCRRDGSRVKSSVSKVIEYSKMGSVEAEEGIAGNIIGLAGFEDVDIGETIVGSE